MAKLYPTDSKINNSKMNPKKETVSFLLSYSKSFCVLETKDFSFELNKN